jgi:uncharacterized protein (TIGR04222 family)
MFDLFLQIPSYFYLSLLIATLVIGWLWLNIDNSTHYPLPELTELNEFEMATLRDGKNGIIQTALFNLWRYRLIMIKGKGEQTRILQKRIFKDWPLGRIEKIFHHFASDPRKPEEFFSNTGLQSEINKFIQPIEQNLEERHLKRTTYELKQAWQTFSVIAFFLVSIVSLGGIKLYFDMAYNKPVDFLITFFIMMIFIATVILMILLFLIPSRSTQLGHRYQKQLKQHFKWFKEHAIHQTNPTILVAIFGVSATDNFSLFASFEKEFNPRAHPGGTGGVGHGGGHDGGDGGGSSGGCGGGGGTGGCGGGGG